MNRPPSLVALPAPILNESPASWVMRLCQYHQSWPNQICGVLGLPRMLDFDVELSLEHLHRLAYATLVEQMSLVCMDSRFLHIRSSEQRRTVLLLQGSSHGYATYRYCPACLREDPMPYWRLTWRMAYFYVCPKHRCVMLDRCLACNAMLEAFPTKKGGFFEGSDQPICCFCPACRADLGQFSAEVLRDCELLRGVLALQQVVTAALLHGCFSIYGINGRFSLEDLPKILMMGVSRYVESHDLQKQALLAARLMKSFGRMPKRNLVNEDAQVLLTPSSYPGDSLCRWANMVWKARFFDVIEQIRQVANDQACLMRSSESL